jgi:hypothetical protein
MLDFCLLVYTLFAACIGNITTNGFLQLGPLQYWHVVPTQSVRQSWSFAWPPGDNVNIKRTGEWSLILGAMAIHEVFFRAKRVPPISINLS